MEEKRKIFEKFKIKEIVFLAIVSAACMVTCAVMPLVVSLQTTVFGIAQLVTSLQIGIFYTIGVMRVRKTGSFFMIALLTGLFQLLMAPAMFFSNIILGILLELVALIFFKGFTSNKAIYVCVSLYNPLSLPFNVLYNYLFGEEAMVAVFSAVPWLTVVMTLAVIGVSILGVFCGSKIFKELERSGAIKK